MAKSPNTITRPTKAVFWNIQGSRHPEALNRRLHQFAFEEGVELFCLTEVTDTSFDTDVPIVHTSTRRDEAVSYLDGLGRIRGALPGFKYYYDTARRSTWTCKVTNQQVPDVGFGSLLISRSRLKIIEQSSRTILGHSAWGDRARVLQWVIFDRGSVRYLLAHLHGVWFAENTKGDHPARLEQSTAITLELELQDEGDAWKITTLEASGM